MKDIKTATILLLPYLTVCSALYHLAYWSVFNMNGLEVVSISDLIRTSIVPFASNSTLLFYSVLPLLFISLREMKKTPILEEGWKNYIFFFVWWIVFLLFFYKKWWGLFPLFAAIAPTAYLLKYDVIAFKQFTYSQIFNVCFIVCLLPGFFFSAGKIEAEKVADNVSFKYLVSNFTGHTLKPLTIKYLGSTEDRLILSDLRNDNIIEIKKDLLDTIQFKSFSQKTDESGASPLPLIEADGSRTK